MKSKMDTDEMQGLCINKGEDNMLKTTEDWDAGLQGQLDKIKTELPSSSNNGARNVEAGTQIDPHLVNMSFKNEPDAELYTEPLLSANNTQLVIQRSIKQEIPQISSCSTSVTPNVYNPQCAARSGKGAPAQAEHEIKSYAAYYDIPIKQEVIDINPGNLSIKNETVDNNSVEMIKMETGCTNSGCNSQNRCLHTYRCSKCNLIFTENEVFEAHLKKCSLNKTSAVPSIPQPTCDSEYSGQNLRKLIEKVKTNPCLYNSENEDYNDVQLEEVIWANIACDCGFQSGEFAKGAWLKLKENFHDALAHGHQARKQAKRFKYHKQMEFLLPFMSNNIQGEETLSQMNTDLVLTETNFINEGAENDRSTMHPLMSPAKKQKLMPSPSETSSAINTNKRSREVRTQSRNHSKDIKGRSGSSHPLHMFFLSMCETTKNLPPHLQLQVKRRVFQAVIEAEEAAATINTNRTNSNQPCSSAGSPEESYVGNITGFTVDNSTTRVDNSSSSSQED